MTFDLSADQQAAAQAARAFAVKRLEPQVGTIERTLELPDELAREAIDLVSSAVDPVAMTVAVEELAAVHGAVAVTAVAGAHRPDAAADLAGLRGATPPGDSPRAQLGLAAVALGLGRAALEAALGELRGAMGRAGAGDKPHWVAADVATDLEAARLATLAAAQAVERGAGVSDAAVARLLASAAARAAVDAALRIAGPDGYRPGSLLERLARDVRAVALLLGTEERHRTTAADGLLPG